MNALANSGFSETVVRKQETDPSTQPGGLQRPARWLSGEQRHLHEDLRAYTHKHTCTHIQINVLIRKKKKAFNISHVKEIASMGSSPLVQVVEEVARLQIVA